MDRGHLGAAMRYGRSRAVVDGRASEARSDEHTIMGYGGTLLNASGLELNGGASWTRHEIRTERNIAFGTFRDNSKADYNAHAMQFFGRLSQSFGAGRSWVKPYGEAAYVYHRTSGFAEDGEAGLAGRLETNRVGYTTLGFAAQHTIRLDETIPVTFSGGMGWQRMLGRSRMTHDFSFRDQLQTNFTVQGIRLARNAMTASAGFSVRIMPATDVTFSYSGNFSRRTSTHAGIARAAVRF